MSNPMLDAAIGLIFLYLILSIIVSVLQEFVSVALVLNADANYVAKQFAGDDKLRGRAVETAGACYTSYAGQKHLTTLCEREESGAEAAREGNGATGKSATDEMARWNKVLDCVASEIDQATSELTEIRYPIGWHGWSDRGVAVPGSI